MWKALKDTKLDLIYDPPNLLKKCNKFTHVTNLDFYVREIESKLGVNSSERIFANISGANLTKAANMFIYLSSCSKALHNWSRFYRVLFQKYSPDQIVLNLNRILKSGSTPEQESVKSIARKLLQKITSEFPLAYEEIKSSTHINQSSRGKIYLIRSRYPLILFSIGIFDRCHKSSSSFGDDHAPEISISIHTIL